MKKYRVRKGSLLDEALMPVIMVLVIIMASLGNHIIDGM